MNKDQLAQKTLEEAIEIFKRNFSDVWSDKNEFYIENAIRAIMDGGLTDVGTLMMKNSEIQLYPKLTKRLKIFGLKNLRKIQRPD